MIKFLQFPIHKFIFINGERISVFLEHEFMFRRLIFLVDDYPEYFSGDIKYITIDNKENIIITYKNENKNDMYNNSGLNKQLAFIWL